MLRKTLAHYELSERIWQGTTGEIYRARDTRLARDVALKVLPSRVVEDPRLLRHIEAEARRIAALEHPYVVTIHSVEACDGIHFLTMEYLSGWRLDSLVPKNGFSAARFFEIALPLLDGLGAVHDANISHGDLKPSNIMLTTDGIVKLLGFGLGKTLPSLTGGGSEPLPVLAGDPAQSTLGAVPYLAPEQLNGSPPDPVSELFSLGVLMFEMLMGRRPFVGRTTAEMAASILTVTPAPIMEARRDLPASLSHVLDNCLEKDRTRRPRSVRELRRSLTEIKSLTVASGRKAIASIAVLPFVDLSPEKNQEYFCEGMTEALGRDLAGIPGFQVLSKVSLFLRGGAERDVRELGRRFGVDHVLQGSVRRTSHELHVSARLSSVTDGIEVWSGKYDAATGSVFEIQSEILHSVQSALRPGGTTSQPSPPTRDIQAYEFYLRGRKFYYEFRRKGVEHALQMFSTAIKHDPDFGLAHAGIADCCCFLYMYAERREESLRQAESASTRALELNPNLAATHASRGLVLSLSGRHAEAESEFQSAIHQDPNHFDAHYFYARDCFAQGKLEPSARLFEKAAELSPDDYQSPLLVAQVYDDLGRKDAAESARRRGVKITEDHLRAHPGEVRALYMGANGLAALGMKERALEWANLALVIDPKEPMVLYNVACIYSLCGKLEEAIECLENAARAGLAQMGWYEHDSNLDPLRGRPRFKALMKWLEANRADG